MMNCFQSVAFKFNLRHYTMCGDDTVVRDTVLMDLYALDASPEDFAARLVADQGIAPAGSLKEVWRSLTCSPLTSITF
jgi:hypothetical protein